MPAWSLPRVTARRSTIEMPVLGRTLRTLGAPPELERWLYEHWHFPEHAVEAHPFAVVIEASDTPAERVAGTTRRVRLHGDLELDWRTEGARWQTGTEASGVELVLGCTEARIRTWGLSPRGDRDLYAALYLAICETLRASGLLSLHAAVVVREGNATALAGRSGVGKSTTFLRAIRGGWQPLAEDLSWLDPQSMTVYGWDRGVRLWPEGWERLGQEATGAEPWETDPDGKLFLPYERLGTPPTRMATLTRLAALQRTPGEPSRWEPLPPRAAVRELWEATGVPLTPAVRTLAARHTPLLLSQLDLQRLYLGTMPLPL